MLLGILSIWLSVFNFTPIINSEPTNLLANNHDTAGVNSQMLGPWPNNFDSKGMDILAASAIVQDKNSGQILWQKDADSVRPIASITKLMTVLVFLDQVKNLDQTIKIIPEDYKYGGRRYIFTGQIIKARDLLGLALVASSNESIAALVRLTGLSQNRFVELMNEKAQSLQMKQSHFVEPTGLDSKNVSSARDLLRLLDESLAIDLIQKLTTLSDYEFKTVNDNSQTIKVKATDKLLNSFLNVVGGKTGYLEEAGYCLATEIKGENQQSVRIVVLDSPTSSQRFNDVKALGWWVFTRFSWPRL